MRTVLYVITFITTILVVIVLNDLIFERKKQIKARLEEIRFINPLEEEEDALRQPLTDRIIKPIYESFLRFIGSVAPKRVKAKYEQLIAEAGSPKNFTVTRIMSTQIMFALLVGGLMFLASRKNSIMLVIAATVMAFILPFSLIRTKAIQRKKQITRELPDLLDLLYISVEAGLSFDMGLRKCVDKMKGPLSEEISRCLEEMSKGRERQEALRGIVKRTDVEDLSYFVTSVIQTEQLGSDITNMLRIQSDTMRQKRKQRAEESALKIPVKMLFPLIFLIFPAMFIVVLGPAMINIVKVLGNGF